MSNDTPKAEIPNHNEQTTTLVDEDGKPLPLEPNEEPSYTLSGSVLICHPLNEEAYISIGAQEFPAEESGWDREYGITASNGIGGLRKVEATPEGLLRALAVMLGYKLKKTSDGFIGWDSVEAKKY
jgi:hypothetical protein